MMIWRLKTLQWRVPIGSKRKKCWFIICPNAGHHHREDWRDWCHMRHFDPRHIRHHCREDWAPCPLWGDPKMVAYFIWFSIVRKRLGCTQPRWPDMESPSSFSSYTFSQFRFYVIFTLQETSKEMNPHFLFEQSKHLKYIQPYLGPTCTREDMAEGCWIPSISNYPQKTGVCLSLGAVPHNQVTFFTILAFPITDWLTQTLLSCHGHDQHPQDDDHQKDEPRRGGALWSCFYTAWWTSLCPGDYHKYGI